VGSEDQLTRSGGGTIEPELRAAARVVAHRPALSRMGGALYFVAEPPVALWLLLKGVRHA
jgi:hypothetical protein